MGLSKRQVQLRYGLNQRLIQTMLGGGVLTLLPGCTYLRPRIDPSSLASLQEGEHYIVCRECGAYQAQITPRHLKSCSGTSLQDYRRKWVNQPLLSTWCSRNKAKTEEQRKAQSDTLKARFQTPQGEITRQQIAEHSRLVMASGYLDRAANHLRSLAQDPVMREMRRQNMLDRWGSGDLREVVEGWHRDNRAESLRSAANARSHIKKRYTKLHQKLKEGLVAVGVDSETEYSVGWYSIDEAIPDLRIAIEADGCYWHGCTKCGFDVPHENIHLDKRKTTYLVNRGWVVLRFPEHEVHSDLHGCVQQVQDAIARVRREVPLSNRQASRMESTHAT